MRSLIKSPVIAARRTVRAARARRHTGDRPESRVVVTAAQQLRWSDPGTRRVAILTDVRRGREIADLIQQLRAHRVYLLAPEGVPKWGLAHSKAELLLAANLAQINWHLKRIGPVDAIVDLDRHHDESYRAVLERLIYHLADGGRYVIDPAAVRDKNQWGDLVAFVATALTAATSAGDGSPSRSERELGDAVDQVTLGEGVFAVTKQGEHYLKMRDTDVSRFLPTRATGVTVTVFKRQPAAVFASRTAVTHHGATIPSGHFATQFDCPRLEARHYTGDVALSTHSLLFCRGTVLPESFRYPRERVLSNVKLVDVSAEFARVPDEHRPVDRLDGTYFHLDSPFPGHFGHVMTEVVSRLWGWEPTLRAHPEVKVIFRIPYPNHRTPVLEYALFEAFGIERERIVVTDHPVLLESVIGVTPMWQNQIPHYVHPDLGAVWARIRDRLAARSTASSPELIFVSRREALTNRGCRNTEQVEEIFRGRGFTVVYPEELSISDQAKTFHDARVVAGFGGSAMFNIAHCAALGQLIVLNHEAYTARNEHLYASVLGAASDYFWSTPTVQHPRGGWSEEAFRSSWEFDFDRNGRDLAELLDRVTR